MTSGKNAAAAAGPVHGRDVMDEYQKIASDLNLQVSCVFKKFSSCTKNVPCLKPYITLFVFFFNEMKKVETK